MNCSDRLEAIECKGDGSNEMMTMSLVTALCVLETKADGQGVVALSQHHGGTVCVCLYAISSLIADMLH